MDKSYWDSYYRLKGGVHYPTSFAETCLQSWIPRNSCILELGSGNGRDAFYFAEHGHMVIGIDQCEFVTAQNRQRAREWCKQDRLTFVSSDFTEFPLELQATPTVVYSRFSMHTISKPQREHVAEKIYELLPESGIFLIECRSTRDPLLNEGRRLSDTETVTDHYRSFVDANEFLALLLSVGYRPKFFVESNGLATFERDDPVVARYVVTKSTG